MSERFIRVYEKMDINEIKSHLLIYGDLGGTCTKCNHIDIKLDQDKCPGCDTDIQFIAFRNIKTHMPKVQKLLESRPNVKIVDLDDYKRLIGSIKAEEFLK